MLREGRVRKGGEFFFPKLKKKFLCMAALSLSCGTWDLGCGMWEQPAGSRALGLCSLWLAGSLAEALWAKLLQHTGLIAPRHVGS